MSRFNQSTNTKIINRAGGEAFDETDKVKFVSLVLTSMVKDQAYRGADETISELNDLLCKVDSKFAAKTAIYARKVYGLRSISHLIAAYIAKNVKGQVWTKDFFEQIVNRPDDMTEILSLYWKDNKNEPNALRKGFKKVLSTMSEYQLAKYRGEGKEVSLIDVVNVAHPKHTEALAKLIKGELKNEETWEAKISEAGSNEENKKQAWSNLLKENKLGYFALLRNLRNIVESAPELTDLLCERLTNENAIKKSLVLPFRFLSAKKALKESSLDTLAVRKVMSAISQAVEISLNNVPKMDGKTLIVLDTSGSMSGDPIDNGALFASVLYKTNNADLILFSDEAKYLNIDANYPVMAINDAIKGDLDCSGTNFHAPFQIADKAYDRIIILSDQQGWMGYDNPVSSFNEYKERTNCNPKIFSFDLTGYGSIQFPEKNIYCLAGFSEKTLDIIEKLEKDKNAMIKEIEEKIKL